MHRQIVLDTETTGLRVEDGHRIIEIGCIELLDRKFTGNQFHYYLNPGREIEAASIAVHGIKDDFLKDKPAFASIVEEFIAFISEAELIIHNAAFDVAFLDYELSLLAGSYKNMANYCRVIDTLQLARTRHVGQRNSLDALCKRYHVDNSKRDLHGALLDAHLLAQVYLAMTGGQGNFFESFNEQPLETSEQTITPTERLDKHYQLLVLTATPEEQASHEKYLATMREKNKCLWMEETALLSESA